jgi:hypothetical protein
MDFVFIPSTSQVYTEPANVYSQDGNAQVVFDPDATQTFVQVGYSQSGAVVVLFAPAAGQEFGTIHRANPQFLFSFSAGQAWAGAPPTEQWTQQGGAVLTLIPAFLHAHDDPYFGPSDDDTQASIAGFPTHTPFSINVTPEINTEVYYELRVRSTDPKWLTNKGLAGYPVRVNITINGISFGSVGLSRQRLVIGPYSGSIYTYLRSALLAGSVQINLSGYEDFGTYTLPQNLSSTTLRVRAYTTAYERYLFG